MTTFIQRRNKWIINAFTISVLLHLLFLFSATVVFFVPIEDRKLPHDYVPAYTYKGAITPATIPLSNTHATAETAPAAKPLKKIDTSLDDYFGVKEIRTGTKQKKSTSMMAASQQYLKQQTQKSLTKQANDSEPMLMIGDPNEVADPLVKMIGRALSANFKYPKEAGMFGIKGQTVLAMTIHPDGHFSDVQIMHSSQNSSLDAAALYAVNAAPKVIGISKLLPQSKRIVVGFVFI